MFRAGLLANHRGVVAVQRIRFRSGVPDGSRVGRCSRIAVRVACRLLCQLFNHVERIEHQLRHVDSTRANPHYRGNNLLLHGRHALRIWPIFSIMSLPVVTFWLPAMSVSLLPPILATRLLAAWL